MKAFITGVAGFVGPHLVRHLLSNGFEVSGIDLNGVQVKGCKIFQCDITDAYEIYSVISKVKPDFIFHLAGQSSVELSWKEPKLTYDINVGGTKNLFDAIAKAKISPKVLLVSSAEVYGTPKSVPITEEHPIAPVSPYGKSKVEQEQLALAYLEKFPIVICRSFPHIGPGQPPKFVCSNFAEQIVNVEKGKADSVKVGNLEARRDFTDVRDVVRAYLLALQKCKPGSIYNVCSGQEHTIKQILGILLSASKSKEIKVEKEESRMRQNDIPALIGSPAKFEAVSGWKPEVRIEKTLSDLLDYWRKK
jgi:GDP-4-dehydro-6-deoxy-D-mannose reductase